MGLQPITDEARRAVEDLLGDLSDDVTQQGREEGVRLLLDGLGFGSIQELAKLVEAARAIAEHAMQGSVARYTCDEHGSHHLAAFQIPADLILNLYRLERY